MTRRCGRRSRISTGLALDRMEFVGECSMSAFLAYAGESTINFQPPTPTDRALAGDDSNVGTYKNNSESFVKLFTRAVSATVQSKRQKADKPKTNVVRRFAYVTRPNRTRL